MYTTKLKEEKRPKSLRKVERVYLPKEYVQILNKSSRLFCVIDVEQKQIKNFVELLKPYFKRIAINQHREGFAISQYKVFIYDHEHPNEIQCSKSTNILVLVNFSIQKSNTLPELSAAVPLYTKPLQLKKIKYENIMVLANKYVPQNDIWFYQELKSDEMDDADTEYTDDLDGE